MNLPTERRALYNLLRMRWEKDQEVMVEPWQVEDLRLKSTQVLFKNLRPFGIEWDKTSFIEDAQQFDNPEDLTEEVIKDIPLDSFSLDRLYLIVFELWRRLVPEKRSLSIFCDELDYQIGKFHNNTLDSAEAIEDVLSNFQCLLSECADIGEDAKEAYQTFITNCAADVETFLYEFIAECLDTDNVDYAIDLYEGFHPYVKDPKWFELLYVRILMFTNQDAVGDLIPLLIEQGKKCGSLEYQLELISMLTHHEDLNLFRQAVLQTVEFVETEEDFLDLLSLCADFFELNDYDSQFEQIDSILSERESVPLDSPFGADDLDLKKLQTIVS